MLLDVDILKIYIQSWKLPNVRQIFLHNSKFYQKKNILDGSHIVNGLFSSFVYHKFFDFLPVLAP